MVEEIQGQRLVMYDLTPQQAVLHFACHGDEIYDEAKSVRNLVQNAVMVAGSLPIRRPDDVLALAQVAALLTPRKRPVKPTPNRQLDLL